MRKLSLLVVALLVLLAGCLNSSGHGLTMESKPFSEGDVPTAVSEVRGGFCQTGVLGFMPVSQQVKGVTLPKEDGSREVIVKVCFVYLRQACVNMYQYGGGFHEYKRYPYAESFEFCQDATLPLVSSGSNKTGGMN